MTNHDNFFSQYFLSVLDPLLGSPARYQKISRPPFTRGSRGYAAAQPMFFFVCKKWLPPSAPLQNIHTPSLGNLVRNRYPPPMREILHSP